MEFRVILDTPLVAPMVSDDVVKRYLDRGWIKEKRLQRVFPRDSQGRAYIPQTSEAPKVGALRADRWVEGALRRVDREAARLLKIVGGRIVIPEQPLVGIRPIISIEEEKPETLECFEYVDSTFELTFRILPPSSDEELKRLTLALAKAGVEAGLGASHTHGMGRFRVELVATKK